MSKRFRYNSKREIASNGVYRHKQLINPGEVVEVDHQLAREARPAAEQLMFKHANGKVKPNKVDKLP